METRTVPRISLNPGELFRDLGDGFVLTGPKEALQAADAPSAQSTIWRHDTYGPHDRICATIADEKPYVELFR